jgi:hypothetical protein
VWGALGKALDEWSDPEWLLFLAALLLPAAVLGAAGQAQRASFFAGLAVYLGVLKWLGWAVLTRPGRYRHPYLLFPAEVLAGLAVLALWFYLRNLVGLWWPASYSLHELAALPYTLAGLHLLAGARRALLGLGPRAGWRRALLQRGALYVPFVVTLVVVFWIVSGVLHVQTTDSIGHATFAKVYLHDGLFYVGPAGQGPIRYPSGFGAINAVAAAVAPLTLVQVVNLQHALLLVTGVFLLTSTVAVLSGRTLWFLHSLPLPFLSLFPLYSLYPCLCYEGPPRQVAPALMAGLCLLPVLGPAARPGPFYRLLAVEAVLALLTLALNPVCAIFLVPAGLLAAAVNTWRGVRQLGQPWLRVLGAQALFLAAAALLVLGCDRYYAPLIRGFFEAGTVAQGRDLTDQASTDQASTEPPFWLASGLEELRLVWRKLGERLTGFDEEVPTYDLYLESPDQRWPHFQGWQARFPQRAVPWLAMGLGLAALAAALRARGPGPQAGIRPLAGLVAVCGVLWLVVKLGAAFLGGALSKAAFNTALLKMYISLLAIHWELMIVFLSSAAAGAVLYLAAERIAGTSPVRAGWLKIAVYGCGILAFALIFMNPQKSGFMVLPSRPYTKPVEPEDLEVVAWIDAHLPPEKGLIGLAARTVDQGPQSTEKQIFPLDGAQALLLYGKHSNCCFTHWELSRAHGYDDYKAHVKDRLDVAWCLQNNIRYFYVPKSSLGYNPGLARAIAQHSLEPVFQAGASGVYQVVTPGGVRQLMGAVRRRQHALGRSPTGDPPQPKPPGMSGSRRPRRQRNSVRTPASHE